MALQTFTPSLTASGLLTAGAFTAGGATLVLGGTSDAHAALRFDTSAIASTDYPMEANLTVRVNAKGAGIAAGWALWRSGFAGATPVIGEYDLPQSDKAPIRNQISPNANPLIEATDPVGYIANAFVPLVAIKTGAGAFSDFEIRSVLTPTGATDTLTIDGPSAATNKPTLTVTTYTLAQFEDPDNIYRSVASGAESIFAFAIEPTEGTAVKPDTIVEATSISFGGTPNDLFSRAFTQDRAKYSKAAVGAFMSAGSVTIDLTPEKCWKLLRGLMKITNTTVNGDGTNTHTFKACQSHEIASFTAIVKRGRLWQIYTGCKISSMTINVSLDAIPTATISLMALQEWHYDYTSAGVDTEFIFSSTAASDTETNGVYSFVDAAVNISGATALDVNTFDISMNNDLRPRRGLNGRREATSHYALGFTVGANFRADFRDEAIIRRLSGDGSKVFPTKARKNLLFDTVSLSISRGDIKDAITFTMPRGKYLTGTYEVQSEDVVEISAAIQATRDTAAKTNLTITLTTHEPASAFAASTDYITVVPDNDIQS
jgi:hypothetical protein